MQFATPSDLLAWSLPRHMGSQEADQHFAHYYHSFQRNFGPLRRRKYDWQLSNLTDRVRSGEVRSVLDVGCGCGTVSLWLTLQGASVTGIDLEAIRLSIARYRAAELGIDPSFQLTSLFDVDETFDAIWIEQAFHHIEPRAAVWTHLAERLNPGGRLYICDMNGWSPLIQAEMVRLRGFRTIASHTDEDGTVHQYGNERITVPGALTKGFSRAGVRTESSTLFGVLPNAPWAERLAPLERWAPAFFAPAFTHYLWIGRRA